MQFTKHSYLSKFKELPSVSFTKTHNHIIKVPNILPDSNTGFYLIEVRNKIIKVGIFGIGVKSTLKSRFSMYRGHGKDFTKAKKRDGSYNTIKELVSSLKVGESATVKIYEAPREFTYINEVGAPMQINMAIVEEEVKQVIGTQTLTLQ